MEEEHTNSNDVFPKQVEEKEKRMLRARKEEKRSVWAGFGLFGIIGWSVAIPTLAGAGIGRWLDRAYPQSYSWTLALLVAGIIAGCFSAWHWVSKEQNDMHKSNKE